MKTTFDRGAKDKAIISECEVSRKKFTGPQRGRFPENDDVVFMFYQERCKAAIKYTLFIWHI
jgi:hypothetical protein